MTRSVVRGPYARRIGAAVAAAALLGACSSAGDGTSTAGRTGEPPAGPPGGTLTVVVPGDPTVGLDPAVADPRVLRAVGPMVTATLMRPSVEDASPQPWLAESVTASSDAREWTIVLRPDAAFASGVPMTASDVAFGLTEAAADPARATRFGGDAAASWFVSATARDARTIVVKLAQPHAAFDRLVLAAPEFGCVRADYAGLSRAEYYRRPDGCGPYAFEPTTAATPAVTPAATSAPATAPATTPARATGVTTAATPSAAPAPTPGEQRLIRNVRYPFADEVRADGLRVTNAQASAPAVVVDAAAASSGAARFSVSSPAVTSVVVLRNSPPTSDRNLRQAVLALVDGSAMAAVGAGSVPPRSGLTPPGWAAGAEIGAPVARPGAAAAALGLVDDTARTLTVLVASGDTVGRARAEVLAEQAAPRGLTVTLDVASQRRYARLVASGRFEAAVRSIDTTVAHAAEVTRWWRSTNALGGGWPLDAAETAFAGQVAPGGAAAVASADFERARIDGGWAIPLAVDVRRVGIVGDVLGVRVGPDGSLPLERFALGATPTGG